MTPAGNRRFFQSLHRRDESLSYAASFGLLHGDAPRCRPRRPRILRAGSVSGCRPFPKKPIPTWTSRCCGKSRSRARLANTPGPRGLSLNPSGFVMKPRSNRPVRVGNPWSRPRSRQSKNVPKAPEIRVGYSGAPRCCRQAAGGTFFRPAAGSPARVLRALGCREAGCRSEWADSTACFLSERRPVVLLGSPHRLESPLATRRGCRSGFGDVGGS